LPEFFSEVARLLKPNGKFFLTTDYWEERIEVSSAAMAFGLPWKVFCRAEIENLLDAAESVGLMPIAREPIPQCHSRPIYWQKLEYTFINLNFLKIKLITDWCPDSLLPCPSQL